CILFAFGIAALVGWINGFLVVTTGLPSFIVTLGGLFILRGLTIGITRDMTGRTQIPGMAQLSQGDPLAPWFGGQAFQGLFTWAGAYGLVAEVPHGAAGGG